MFRRFSEFSCQEWYRSERVDENIFKIRETFIDEGHGCNMWLVRGRHRNLLFDTGFGYVSLRSFLGEDVSRNVVAVSSHSHCDHIGCNHEFECRCIHSAEASVLANPTGANTIYDPYAVPEMIAVPIDPLEVKSHKITPAAPTRLLEGGDVIDLGDRAFEVIHVPGHSPGSIMLYDRRDQILFSGDAVHNGSRGIGRTSWYGADQDQYLASCERIRELPVRTCHGGHFASFDGARYRQIVEEFIAWRWAVTVEAEPSKTSQ
ncbi:MAG: MBL fold metallo-hydrolase [Mesorhizobium sp.]|nr:MBL fold metallo-hydrolase [Mesorhizobium sp. M5C.F.Ca.IN.020.32.2.1]RUV91209.1 MBL fold metallo-hydrolase [Mesorhizobium sp. M5C.F.Ca.IN.020.14.1.1]RWE12676.1 MAG: MBL fold metallo-hydrolase [Mesorhizobium sp.]RWH42649.1 MAG: MBL fold metallo-hydrolase [Mesorhizobium sp.]RWH54452.1 MAG: MBL fold metallo-hydrolase [Mesorhizobium sp.]